MNFLYDLQHCLVDSATGLSNEPPKIPALISGKSVVLLSGTPTAGKYERLWSQLHLLGWDISKKAFWKSYVETEWVENGDGYFLSFLWFDYLLQQVLWSGQVSGWD